MQSMRGTYQSDGQMVELSASRALLICMPEFESRLGLSFDCFFNISDNTYMQLHVHVHVATCSYREILSRLCESDVKR